MEISLETILELAPDQASLKAAKGLLKPAKWPVLGQASGINTIWGECQGSGSKPYYTVADVVDHGYKCTCPSRKFPCKHVLALLWQFSDAGSSFTESEVPQWVTDWLGRRRRAPTNNQAQEKKATPSKDINATAEASETLSAEELAKKDAQQKQRAAQSKAKTEACVSDGLIEFQQWLDDQLVNGISQLIKEITERCRRIAARLVDAKATNFAARIDELPAKIMPLCSTLQPQAVYQELGKLALLSEAWFVDCDNIDVRRAIVTGETREQVLSNPHSVRVKGIWETVGERIETRKDGLIAHSKWLINITEPHVEPALLLDFYPAATGRKTVSNSIGRKIEGELIFYPAKILQRALLGEYKTFEGKYDEAELAVMDHQLQFQRHLRATPWIEEFPAILGAGRVLNDGKGTFWWYSSDGTQTLALSNNEINPVILGSELKRAFVVSSGSKGTLLSVTTKNWGVIEC